MTEAEWIRCTDPSLLLAFVGSQPGERRLRLLAAAAGCGRHRQAAIADRGQPGNVDAMAGCAGGPAAVAALDATTDSVGEPAAPARPSSNKLLDDVVLSAHRAAYDRATAVASATDFAAVQRLQADQFRDILGNPFRQAGFDPRWRTADVLGLARGIDEACAFDRLPLLADALMDAGCDDEAVLDHCRSAGPHVPGCWVVDLALGTKEGRGA